MHPPSGLTGSTILLATLLSVGAACAQEVRPAGSPPHVHKLTVMNGSLPTVSYFVQRGSPHQQALYRSLQFTENELTLTEEVQRLRMAATARETAGSGQRGWFRPGLGYLGYGSDFYYPATDSALQLINLRQEIQTELAKAKSPAALQDRKAPQGQAQAVEMAMSALLQGRAFAAANRPMAMVPAFSSVSARLAGPPRLGPSMPYPSTALAGSGIRRGYR